MIHCDIDVAELGKLRRPDVALRGDLSEIFHALTVKLDLADWHKEINQLKQQFDFRYAENHGNQPINPWWLIHSVSQQKIKTPLLPRTWGNIKCGRLSICNIMPLKISSPPQASAQWALACLQRLGRKSPSTR